MPDDSRLILEKAYRDEHNLDRWFLYCRKCNAVTDMIGPSVWELLSGKGYKCMSAFKASTEKQVIETCCPTIFAACVADNVFDDNELIFYPEKYHILSDSGRLEFAIFRSWLSQSIQRVFLAEINLTTSIVIETLNDLTSGHSAANIQLITARWNTYGRVAFSSYDNVAKGKSQQSIQADAVHQLPPSTAEAIQEINDFYENLQTEHSPLIPFPAKQLGSEFMSLIATSEPLANSPLERFQLPLDIMLFLIECKMNAISCGRYHIGCETIDNYFASTIFRLDK